MGTDVETIVELSAGCLFGPRQVVVGEGSLDRLATLVRFWSITEGKVLLVSDRVLFGLGLVDRIRLLLEATGYTTDVCADLAGEPNGDTVDGVIEQARRGAYVAVVGVGGGSALDSAKLAALMAKNPGSISAYAGNNHFRSPGLPLFLVPTTAGTGSEASKNAVISLGDHKVVISHPYLSPTVAVLDPEVTLSAPKGVTAASGLDALSHAVESCLSTQANPLTRSIGLAAIRVIREALLVAYTDGNNLESRRQMLYGSFLSGLSIAGGLVVGHSMAYTIAARVPLAHGVTAGMALPYCISYNLPLASEDVFLVEQQFGVQEGSLALILSELNASVGLPESLRAVGIGDSDVDGMVDECVTRYPRPNNPAPLERERLARLYRFFLDGDIRAAVQAMSKE